jgi:hypothetical protein
MPELRDPTVLAAIITGVVALAAIIGSVCTTWLTLRHQRGVAHEDRVWDRRADAYMGFFVLADALKNGVDYPESRLPETIGAIYAFGSSTVVELLERIPSVSTEIAEGRGVTGSVAEQMRAELPGRHK